MFKGKIVTARILDGLLKGPTSRYPAPHINVVTLV